LSIQAVELVAVWTDLAGPTVAGRIVNSLDENG